MKLGLSVLSVVLIAALGCSGMDDLRAFNQGVSQFKGKRFEEAVNSFAASVEVAGDSNAHFNLTLSHLELLRSQESPPPAGVAAGVAAATVARGLPDLEAKRTADLWYIEGSVQQLAAQPSLARAAFEQALKLAPAHALSLYGLLELSPEAETHTGRYLLAQSKPEPLTIEAKLSK